MPEAPHFRKLWCTECWYSFRVPTGAIERMQTINCPDCAAEGKPVGHIVRGMVFCNDCHAFGCNAAVCRCDCHKEEIGG
jgi:hypothetical protein